MKTVCRLLFVAALPVLISCGGPPSSRTYIPDTSNSSGGPEVDQGPTQTTVVMKTSMGIIKIGLYDKKAPNTVKNFLEYVDDEFYDGTIFHRVIPDFMIQCGGFTPKMKEKKTSDMIKNESGNGLRNKRGTLAMARTGDPHSASAQFFINVKDNDFLDKSKAKDGWGYAVFGKVLEGMDVVEKIRNVKTETAMVKVPIKLKGKLSYDEAPFENVPVEPVLIESIRRVTVETKKETTNKATESGKQTSAKITDNKKDSSGK